MDPLVTGSTAAAACFKKVSVQYPPVNLPPIFRKAPSDHILCLSKRLPTQRFFTKTKKRLGGGHGHGQITGSIHGTTQFGLPQLANIATLYLYDDDGIRCL
jgi:hypothetical protein